MRLCCSSSSEKEQSETKAPNMLRFANSKYMKILDVDDEEKIKPKIVRKQRRLLTDEMEERTNEGPAPDRSEVTHTSYFFLQLVRIGCTNYDETERPRPRRMNRYKSRGQRKCALLSLFVITRKNFSITEQLLVQVLPIKKQTTSILSDFIVAASYVVFDFDSIISILQWQRVNVSVSLYELRV